MKRTCWSSKPYLLSSRKSKLSAWPQFAKWGIQKFYTSPYIMFIWFKKNSSIIIIVIFLLWVSHTSVRWWAFTGVWVAASLHRFFRTLLSILPNLNNLDSLDSFLIPNSPLSKPLRYCSKRANCNCHPHVPRATSLLRFSRTLLSILPNLNNLDSLDSFLIPNSPLSNHLRDRSKRANCNCHPHVPRATSLHRFSRTLLSILPNLNNLDSLYSFLIPNSPLSKPLRDCSKRANCNHHPHVPRATSLLRSPGLFLVFWPLSTLP